MRVAGIGLGFTGNYSSESQESLGMLAGIGLGFTGNYSKWTSS